MSDPRPLAVPAVENSDTTAPMIDNGKQIRAAANKKGRLEGIRRCRRTSSRDASRRLEVLESLGVDGARSPTSELTSRGKNTIIPVTR